MPGIKKQLTVKKFRPPPPYTYFNWWLSVKAVNDDSYRNESKRKLFTMTLHDYDVKRPNFTFYGDLNIRQRFLFLFLNFDRDLWKEHLANCTRWNKGDLGIKFETQRECNF